MTQKIETEIRAFLAESLLFREDPNALGGDESMLQAGMIDSTGVLELVMFLESNFDIAIQDAEVVPENLDTLNALVAFVARKFHAGVAT
jgi:acyl carrier protein